MLLRQMKTFVMIVDENSFTEAAEKLYISQSAVSQQVTALENELGVKLIERRNRHFHLTDAGQFFYKKAKKLLRDADKIVTQTRDISHDSNILTVGYLNLYNGAELHEAVAEFSAEFPDAVLNIISGTHEDLYHGLVDKTIDLAINDQRRNFSEDYFNDVICYAPCYAEISGNNPLSASERLEISQLEDMLCIVIAPAAQQAHEEEFYRDILGFDSPVIFAETLEQARMLVIGNRGFLPIEEVGTPLTAMGAIIRVPLYRGGTQMIRKYCLFRRRDNSNKYAERFSEIIKAKIFA